MKLSSAVFLATLFGLLSPAMAADSHVVVEPLKVPTGGRAGFQLIDAEKAGLTPKGKAIHPDKKKIRETGNSGLAAGDVDGDGLVDVFVCGMSGPNTRTGISVTGNSRTSPRPPAWPAAAGD